MNEDGVHADIPDTEYHSLPSLSSSGAKLLLPPSTPAKFRERMDNPPPPKPHFDFGHLVHKLVLDAGSDIEVIDAEDWRSKAAREARDQAHAEGKIPALKDEYRQAVLMRRAVRYHPIAGSLFDSGDAEMSLYTTDPDTGIKLRARPDWMTQRRDGRLWLVDLKTCADADPETFGRTAHKWGYHLQFAWYHTVARLLELDESPAFVFVNVEKEPPYLVSVCELDLDAYQLGRADMRRAIRIYQQCTETGVWPGYAEDVHSISLPPWAYPKQPFTYQLGETA
jgi:hypothetical protein